MKDIHDQTYYELLEIDATATQEEILKAYNRARATYGHNSPALYSLFNKEEAQELLRLIDEAYAVLSNQFKRKQYDNESSEPPPPKPVKDKPVDRRRAATPPQAVTPDLSMGATAIPGADVRVFDDAPDVKAEPPQPVVTASTQIKEAPHSTGTTPFGSYTIDPLFEEEIRKTENFPGTFIQKVRLYKNISLDQICETTKISRPYLIAVESNNFTSLPAPVFVRGFIVQIAKILGLDTLKVSNSFITLLKEGQKK